MLSRLCAVPWGGAALLLLFPPVLLDLVPSELCQSTQSGLGPVEGRESQNLPAAAACPSSQASFHPPPPDSSVHSQAGPPLRTRWHHGSHPSFRHLTFFFFSFHSHLSSSEISWRCCLLTWGHTDRGTCPEGAVRTSFDGMT